MEISYLWEVAEIIHCLTWAGSIIYINYSVFSLCNHVCPTWEQNKDFPCKRNSVDMGLKFLCLGDMRGRWRADVRRTGMSGRIILCYKELAVGGFGLYM